MRVYPIGAVTRGLGGKELAELAELAEAGCVAFSDDGRCVMNAALYRRAMEYTLPFGAPVISHAEDDHLSHGTAMNEGVVSTELGIPGAPAAAEDVMVARDILLAELTGAHVHIAHLSTAGAVRLVRDAKARGVRVTAEVTPHHLLLTDEAVRGFDTNTKMNPPLRTKRDVEVLLEGADRRHDRLHRHRSRAARGQREGGRVRPGGLRDRRAGDRGWSVAGPAGEDGRPAAGDAGRAAQPGPGPPARAAGGQPGGGGAGGRDDSRSRGRVDDRPGAVSVEEPQLALRRAGRSRDGRGRRSWGVESYGSEGSRAGAARRPRVPRPAAGRRRGDRPARSSSTPRCRDIRRSSPTRLIAARS